MEGIKNRHNGATTATLLHITRSGTNHGEGAMMTHMAGTTKFNLHLHLHTTKKNLHTSVGIKKLHRKSI